jgi:hypothetical protein
MATSPLPSCKTGETITWLSLPPDAKYDNAKDAISINGLRTRCLTDNEIKSMRAIDTSLQLAIHSDGPVDICDENGTVVASTRTLQAAFLVAKAIYAAARHTWTEEEIERERRIAFQHGVTIKAGDTLDDYETANMPRGSVVYADGYIFQRGLGKWVDQQGELAPIPHNGTFLGIVERPFGLPPVDDDDDEDGYETGCPYGFYDCCG